RERERAAGAGVALTAARAGAGPKARLGRLAAGAQESGDAGLGDGARVASSPEPIMKYLQNGGFQSHPHMRLTIGLALGLLAAFWVTNVALYFAHMNLSPASVVAYYRGDEARFMAPRSAESMLEVTHMHLPMFALVLLLLTHLLVFAPMHNARKTGTIVASFGSALLMEAAGWLTRFVHPGFAWLK